MLQIRNWLDLNLKSVLLIRIRLDLHLKSVLRIRIGVDLHLKSLLRIRIRMDLNLKSVFLIRIRLDLNLKSALRIVSHEGPGPDRKDRNQPWITPNFTQHIYVKLNIHPRPLKAGFLHVLKFRDTASFPQK